MHLSSVFSKERILSMTSLSLFIFDPFFVIVVNGNCCVIAFIQILKYIDLGHLARAKERSSH